MFEPRPHNPALAATFILCATAFIAASTLMAKALGGDQFGPALHPMQISHGRYLFAFVAISGAVAAMRPRFSDIQWRLHGARTFLGWSGVTLMFASVAYIPMADATAISFLNPVFAMILAIPLLGEKVGPWRWSAAGIALVGAMVLLRPTPESFQPAALLALGAAVFLGTEVIVIKRLSAREGPLQILFINNLLGLLLSSFAVAFVWQPVTMTQWVLLAGVGLAMAAAQACFVNGMARADASYVAPFSYATLIFAALYDAFFYGAIPDAVTLLGASIIIAGGVLLALREARLKKQ
jgi:drug/metabolite transporter (DMT)-like permease